MARRAGLGSSLANKRAGVAARQGHLNPARRRRHEEREYRESQQNQFFHERMSFLAFFSVLFG